MSGPTPIPFHLPYYGEAAERILREALASGSLHGNGKIVSDLEERLSDLIGAMVLLTPSCTSALEIAGQAIGLGSGDEFIVPGYTFLSSAAAFTQTGARPVFVDISQENLSLDLAAVEAAITARTKAIIAVHYAGQAADLAALRALADRHAIALIEDSAQGFLCQQNGTWLGRAGAFGCYSFHDSKVFSAGEGGALVINDNALRDRAIRIREKGSNRREFLAGRVDRYGWVAQGTSGYLGGLSAALLDGQFQEREAIFAKRSALFAAYDCALRAPLAKAGISMLTPRADERLTFHILWLMLPSAVMQRAMGAHLAADKISASAHYPALHRSDFAHQNGFSPNSALPITDRAATCMLRLPLYTGMALADVERVISSVLTFLETPQ